MLHLAPLLFDACTFILLNTNDEYKQQFLDLFAAPKKKPTATVIDLTEYLANRREPTKLMKQYSEEVK